jgi:uroporphyrinogen decarboxylase
LSGDPIYLEHENPLENIASRIKAFYNAGYDYTVINSSMLNDLTLWFPTAEQDAKKTISLNEGIVITDKKSFDVYKWPRVDTNAYSLFKDVGDILPQGMKLIATGPGGVLENTIRLVGYENLCFMTLEDVSLAEKVFENVGSRLLTHFKICLEYDSVGAIISNDDWGFNTQTMLSPEMLRKYVFPWHKEIVAAAHKAGKPVILHSCGNLDAVMDDIIYDMKFDGKHSYEDGICPVEQAYEKWHDKIAIMGGIDVHFMCTASPDEIFTRSQKMIERSAGRGGFALGTGNSVPEYIPQENYLAMISAAVGKVEFPEPEKVFEYS